MSKLIFPIIFWLIMALPVYSAGMEIFFWFMAVPLIILTTWCARLFAEMLGGALSLDCGDIPVNENLNPVLLFTVFSWIVFLGITITPSLLKT